MAKIFTGLLVAGGVLCLFLAGKLAFTIRALDVQILDVYFVVIPRYLLILSAGLFLAALMAWKEFVSQ